MIGQNMAMSSAQAQPGMVPGTKNRAVRDGHRVLADRHLPAHRPQGLSEDEAISLMSVAVDFGVTQVVDGNWGVHAIIKKSLFAGA